MGTTVAIAGASGYAGGELIRLLAGHPGLQVGPLAAHGSAGRPVGEVHPQLGPYADCTFVDTDPAVLAEADVVLLALPHGASAAVAAALPPQLPVLDLGADHRLADPAAWSRYYPGPHAGRWPYGLPELPGARERLAGTHRIAVPGCYATALALAAAPLFGGGLIEADDVVAVAASGTSGAGRAATASLLGSEVMGDVSAYKVGVHQHTAEVEQALTAVAGIPVTLSFTPLLAPMPRGILATVTARVRPGVTADRLRDAVARAYAEEPFVTLLPEGRWPHTAATAGSNACHLQVTLDSHAGRAVVVAALDNLGKGAAGQAVQCLNLALGLPETTGLSALGVAP